MRKYLLISLLFFVPIAAFAIGQGPEDCVWPNCAAGWSQSTDCSAIAAEGAGCWQTDVDTLWIGDGAAPPEKIGGGGTGGTMFKSVYDGDNNGRVQFAEAMNMAGCSYGEIAFIGPNMNFSADCDLTPELQIVGGTSVITSVDIAHGFGGATGGAAVCIYRDSSVDKICADEDCDGVCDTNAILIREDSTEALTTQLLTRTQATSSTLTARDLRGTLVENTGAAGDIVYTLPTAAAGLHVQIAQVEATGDGDQIAIDPDGTDQILGCTNAGGDQVQSGVDQGSTIRLVGISATQWLCFPGYGTWTDIGP